MPLRLPQKWRTMKSFNLNFYNWFYNVQQSLCWDLGFITLFLAEQQYKVLTNPLITATLRLCILNLSWLAMERDTSHLPISTKVSVRRSPVPYPQWHSASPLLHYCFGLNDPLSSFIDLQCLNSKVFFPACHKRSWQTNACSGLSVSINIRDSTQD